MHTEFNRTIKKGKFKGSKKYHYEFAEENHVGKYSKAKSQKRKKRR